MKSFSAIAEAALDSPYADIGRVLTLEFDGLTLYLSDRTWGTTGADFCLSGTQIYDPLIMSWGTIEQGRLDPYRRTVEGSEMRVTCMNNVPVGGYPCLSSLIDFYDLQFVPVTVVEFPVSGSPSADGYEIFKGAVEGFENVLHAQITFVLSGMELNLKNEFAHEIVETDAYPNADPDDVGKMLPEVWGSPRRVPFMGLESGALTTLAAAMTAAATTISLNDASRWPSSGTGQVGVEEFTWTGKSGNTLTGVTRGSSRTDAVVHPEEYMICELRDNYIFSIGHEISAFDSIWALDAFRGGLRIVPNSQYTLYTGQSGDQKTGYGDKAVVEVNTTKHINRQVHPPLTGAGTSSEDLLATSNDPALPHTFNLDSGSISEEITISGDGSMFNPAFTKNDADEGGSYYIVVYVNVTENSLGSGAGTLEVRLREDTGTPTYTYIYRLYINSTKLGTSGAYIIMSPEKTASNVPEATLSIVASTTAAFNGDVDVEITAIKLLLINYSVGPHMTHARMTESQDSDLPWERWTTGANVTATLTISRASANFSKPFTEISTTGKFWTIMLLRLSGSQSAGKSAISVDDWGGSFREVVAWEIGASFTHTGKFYTDYMLAIPADIAPTADLRIRFTTNGSFAGEAHAYAYEVWILFDEYWARPDTYILSGNSVADTVIGSRIYADLDGYRDDASGTITGTPNALIEKPQHISKDILTRKCNRTTAADIDATTYAAAGTFYNSKSYTLAPVLLDRPDVMRLLQRIAWQARSKSIWEAGVHHLIHTPDTPSSVLSIGRDDVDLNQLWVSFTSATEIQNDFSARYHRDWSGYTDNNPDARAVVIKTDTGSITKYGTRYGDQISIPYVTGETHAQGILDHEIGKQANPWLMVEFIGGHRMAALERCDVVSFLFPDGADDALCQALQYMVVANEDLFEVIDMLRHGDGRIQLKLVCVVRLDRSTIVYDSDNLPTYDSDGNIQTT